MKNSALIFVAVFALACTGKLSEEQRRKFREGQRETEIKVVSEGEIAEATLEEGRRILKVLETIGDDSNKVDSVAVATGTQIRFLKPGDKNASLIENQLIEAYITSAVTGGTQDNVQTAAHDSLIYTKPVVEQLPDGAVSVKGMWSIRMPQKKIVLSIEK